MTIEQAIKAAIKGGYLKQGINSNEEESILRQRRLGYAMNNKYEVLLDPKFWQSLGKELGWNGETETEKIIRQYNMLPENELLKWKYCWHGLIDYLIAGKSIEDYFKELN